jgi:hypothetical protein
VDVRYHNVCVETTDWAPMLFEQVMARIKEENGNAGWNEA